jgi:hypothetical protein
MHHKSQRGVLRLSARGGDHLSLWPRSVIQKRSTAVDGHKCAISVAHGASCLESDSDIGDIRNIAQLKTEAAPKSFDSTLDQAMELLESFYQINKQ